MRLWLLVRDLEIPVRWMLLGDDSAVRNAGYNRQVGISVWCVVMFKTVSIITVLLP